MASRLGESGQDLHHFVSHSPCSASGLLEGLARATAAIAPAYRIIDETKFSQGGQPFGWLAASVLRSLGHPPGRALPLASHPLPPA